MAIVNDALKISDFVWANSGFLLERKILCRIFCAQCAYDSKMEYPLLLLNKSPAVCRKSPEITKGLPG